MVDTIYYQFPCSERIRNGETLQGPIAMNRPQMVPSSVDAVLKLFAFWSLGIFIFTVRTY